MLPLTARYFLINYELLIIKNPSESEIQELIAATAKVKPFRLNVEEKRKDISEIYEQLMQDTENYEKVNKPITKYKTEVVKKMVETVESKKVPLRKITGTDKDGFVVNKYSPSYQLTQADVPLTSLVEKDVEVSIPETVDNEELVLKHSEEFFWKEATILYYRKLKSSIFEQ